MVSQYDDLLLPADLLFYGTAHAFSLNQGPRETTDTHPVTVNVNNKNMIFDVTLSEPDIVNLYDFEEDFEFSDRAADGWSVSIQLLREALSSDSSPVGGSVSDAKVYRLIQICLLYTSPSPRDQRGSRMPSSA